MGYGTHVSVGDTSQERLEKNVGKIKEKIGSGEYKKEEVLWRRYRELLGEINIFLAKPTDGRKRKIDYISREIKAIERL